MTRSARLPAGLLALTGVLIVVCFLSITMGSRAVTFGTVWPALTNFDPSSAAQTVVREMRVPRTLLGLSAGAALGLSGAILQGVTRNPLADPGIMGLNAGAATFIVVGMLVFGAQQMSVYIWLAFLGAAAAMALVYGGRVDRVRPALRGRARPDQWHADDCAARPSSHGSDDSGAHRQLTSRATVGAATRRRRGRFSMVSVSSF